ncbi:conserved hypothetical protein [Cupriavidus necator]|uniref:JAB domain-containing protein n=1 Tax=Cupriavidus necator TaxID=106590 RepID=A0A1K0JA56_CUPNE|nr:conserved hypothetical protein [Cupriavidus necator]
MSPSSLWYQIPGAKWCIHFGPETLAVLAKSVQHGTGSTERVGQLFTPDLTGDVVEIAKVTKLTPKWASFSRVKFDPEVAMAERSALLAQGFHCIGLWHTHPEPRPVPSSQDQALAKEHALAAIPQLSGLVFIIVGTASFPAGLQVWVHDGQQLLAAEPMVQKPRTTD